jgi:dephospho-CoA kinase
MLNESYIFSDDDIYLNMDKWQKKKNMNILFVTGMSGSGKSTLADEIADKYHAEMIELDGLFRGNSEWLSYEHKFVKDYFKAHSEVADKEFQNEKDFEDFLNYLSVRCFQHPNKLYVINGLQIYEYFEVDSFKNKPMVIKGTSVVQSLFQQIKRDSEWVDLDAGEILQRIKYQFESHGQLNDFKRKMIKNSIFLKKGV